MGNRVLLVDDSEVIRQQIAIALEAVGFEIDEAVDGLDALSKLSQDPGRHLVITDMNMPRMDGLKLLRKVKEDAALAHLPVIILTTEGDAELIAQARSAGASAWVVKSAATDKLVAAAKKLAGLG